MTRLDEAGPRAAFRRRVRQRARQVLEGFAVAFAGSLVSVMASIGFSPMWFVLAFSFGLAVATIAIVVVYDYLAPRLRRARR